MIARKIQKQKCILKKWEKREGVQAENPEIMNSHAHNSHITIYNKKKSSTLFEYNLKLSKIQYHRFYLLNEM